MYTQTDEARFSEHDKSRKGMGWIGLMFLTITGQACFSEPTAIPSFLECGPDRACPVGTACKDGRCFISPDSMSATSQSTDAGRLSDIESNGSMPPDDAVGGTPTTEPGVPIGSSVSTDAGTLMSTDSSVPSAVCGDGVRQGDEQCDDGNREDGDGCTNTCLIQCHPSVPTGWRGPTSFGLSGPSVGVPCPANAQGVEYFADPVEGICEPCRCGEPDGAVCGTPQLRCSGRLEADGPEHCGDPFSACDGDMFDWNIPEMGETCAGGNGFNYEDQCEGGLYCLLEPPTRR